MNFLKILKSSSNEAFYVNLEYLQYVNIAENYPGHEREYIPKVKRETEVVKKMLGKKTEVVVRTCADCGEQLDEDEEFCYRCYVEESDGEDTALFNFVFSHNENDLIFESSELSKEEFEDIKKQLELFLKNK